MPHKDQIRWDTRYRDEARYADFEQPRPFLIECAHLLPERGLALDVAMGLGGNAGFLLQHGLRVIGLDISGVAVRRARANLPGLAAAQADLTHFYLPPSRFDVILNFYYLQRSLWSAYRAALRPGGILIFETMTRDMLAVHPDTDPLYLLEPGELRAAFSSLDILIYNEGWTDGRSGHTRAIASLAARKARA